MIFTDWSEDGFAQVHALDVSDLTRLAAQRGLGGIEDFDRRQQSPHS